MPTTTTEAAKIILQSAKEKKCEIFPPFERMKLWVSAPASTKIDKTAEARRINAVAAAKKGK